MIAVSQCHSSTSFVPSEITPYYSFTNGTMQKTEYTALPQPIHYNDGEKTKSFLDSQILRYDELHAKPTLSVFPSTRQKTVSSPVSNDSIQTLYQHHDYLNDRKLHVHFIGSSNPRTAIQCFTHRVYASSKILLDSTPCMCLSNH